MALAPQEAFVHSAYGCHLLMHGDFAPRRDRAAVLARRLDPQYVNTRMHLVNLRLAQQRLDDAGAELEGLGDLAPQSLAATGLAGPLALLRGDTAAALAHYHRVLELAPDHAGAWPRWPARWALPAVPRKAMPGWPRRKRASAPRRSRPTCAPSSRRAAAAPTSRSG
ncbi:MAG: hypothetical protein U1F50_19290 [Rubrivivax sp.]